MEKLEYLAFTFVFTGYPLFFEGFPLGPRRDHIDMAIFRIINLANSIRRPVRVDILFLLRLPGLITLECVIHDLLLCLILSHTDVM